MPSAAPLAAAPSAKADPNLPPLREELLLHRAPAAHDGSPGWTLEDPGRGLFFQIGWAEAEMLARWQLGTPERIAEAIDGQTTLRIDAEDVQALARFLEQHSLLRLSGAQACARYLREAQATRSTHWLSWLIHHYLYLRLPLLRPEPLLERGLSWMRRWILRRGFAMATLTAAVIGLWLVARQWDTFVHTFLHFFTVEGALTAALTLVSAKILHELGHAFVAKHFGCRVASMGVAFIVLWPVLYTDSSGAWRLDSRRRRMMIGAAGMLTETALAAWATLAWSFLPDGMLRSAAFMLATTTWLLTLAVNLNPFARFDGYFLLTDALNVPNLQPRAFALARWRLREWLFGFNDPCPERFARWREHAVIGYAFSTWVYRFFLFTGIALLVYHHVFKLLGIFLFTIEMVFFVIRPIHTELRQWLRRHRAGEVRWNQHGRRSAALLSVALALAVIPWHTRVQAPALARAAEQSQLIAPTGAHLKRILAAPGQTVTAGAPLFVLDSPDLEHELQTLRLRIGVLAWQLDFHAMRENTIAAVPVAQQELQAAHERLAVLERQRAQLTLNAPFAGVLVDRAEPLATGEWVGAGEWLGTVAAPKRTLVEAYVAEDDLQRVQPGDHARFLPDDPSQPSRPLRVVAVAATATSNLDAVPELASVNGGALAAQHTARSTRAEQAGPGTGLTPEQAVYRVLLEPADTTPHNLPIVQATRGTVLIDGAAESLLLRAWRRIVAVLVRESGF